MQRRPRRGSGPKFRLVAGTRLNDARAPLLFGLLNAAQPAVSGRDLARAPPPEHIVCINSQAAHTKLVLPLAPRGSVDVFEAYRKNSFAYDQGNLSSLRTVLTHLSTSELLPCTTHVAVAFPGATPEALALPLRVRPPRFSYRARARAAASGPLQVLVDQGLRHSGGAQSATTAF